MPAAFKRISTIGIVSKKRKSVSADISSPSPAHKSSLSPTHTPTQENTPWSGRRQKAIRLSKRSDQLQPIIHELSYSFQVQSVAVVFRDSVKMDITCRGMLVCLCLPVFWSLLPCLFFAPVLP
jgi:hypothetical protein